MSNRVSIDSNMLRISLPGYDADTASDANLLFASDKRITRILETGAVSIGHTETFSFTATYERAPLMVFYFAEAGYWCHSCAGYPASDIGAQFNPYFAVYRSYAQFYGWAPISTKVSVRYALFEG